MVDLNTCPPTPPPGERSKIKSFMGRTPGIGLLKSKFLTVLGNSNELLNGISNKLTLSMSSSDSDYCDDDEEELPKFDETIDYTKIDFEFRRVKARRAHEEIISGRFRYPNLVPVPHLGSKVKKETADRLKRSHSASASSSSSSSSSSSGSLAKAASAGHSSTTRSNSIESRHSGGYGRAGRAIAGARRSELDIQRDMLKISDILKTNGSSPLIDVQSPLERHCAHAEPTGSAHAELASGGKSATSMRAPMRSKNSNSSTLTSLRDDLEAHLSASVESTDFKNFIRSESQNSVPSWASSISLDCRAGEEPVKEFMKRFTGTLFVNAVAITLELKSEFGAKVRLENGRQWFTRFLLEQKSKAKCIPELSFHALVQYSALVLFECGESDDFTSAAVIMSLCFLFYHEIEVPGCDPYREYLFTFMRKQPLWQTLRFWNAAYFEAVQSEREHRLAAKIRRDAEKSKQKCDIKATEETAALAPPQAIDVPTIDDTQQQQVSAQPEESSSSSSSHHSNALVVPNSSAKEPSAPQTHAEANKEHSSELRMQDYIVFKQLGVFTCNMHALGVPQEMCLEFLKKQMVGANHNLSKEKTKLIKDNIHRMYRETDLWGAKDT